MVLESTTAVLTLCCLLLMSVLWWLSTRRPPGLPPGPGPALPLLGHLHLMEKDPRAKFRQWRRQYGDVFSLYMGRRVAIVLNGYSIIKQALVKQADAFSDRSRFRLLEVVTMSKGVVDTSGPLWKAQRTVSLEILREFGMGKNLLAQKIQEEVSEYIKAMASKNGQSFDMTRLTQISVSNNICSIIFGKRFDYDDPEFQRFIAMLDTVVEGIGAGAITTLFPFLRHIPGDPLRIRKIMGGLQSVLMSFIQPSVDRHLQENDDENADDFIGAYIREMQSERKKPVAEYVNKTNLPKLVFDLFSAGTETTATTIRWTIVYLLRHPDVQEKCHQEVIRVVGQGRPPSWTDRQDMMYLEATIMEVLRMCSLVPLSVPHATSCDITLAGYTIPNDAFVIPNLESVLQDPEVWGDPENFRPERFIGPDGQLTKPDEFIPFSTGRRVCLGEALARMELFLYLATMIQHFRFLPPDDGQLPSLDVIVGIVFSPKPFKVRAVARS